MSNPTAATHRPAALPRARGPLETIYRLGLLTKAGVGALQFLAGLGLRLSPGDSVRKLVDWLTRTRLAQDRDDTLVLALKHWADHLPGTLESFYAWYLMGHGALNVCVILALFLRLRHAYPVAMLVFSGFIAYQLREYIVAGDPSFLVLCAIDATVIVLVTLERAFSPHHRRR